MPRSSRRRALQRIAGRREQPRRPVSSPALPSVTATALEPNGSMADRYYAMAESMNTRGAMELAVPFYRQAVALLLAEREALQQQLGVAAAPAAPGSLPLDELHGLLEAAEALGQGQPAKPEGADLEARIAELSSELTAESALQVIAGLKALAEGHGQQLPVAGLALLGKAQMLLGKTADGLQSFEAGLALAPEQADLQINTGAARLANGDVHGALTLLRGMWKKGLEALDPATQLALLRNLAAAEAKAGNVAAALQLRRRWLELDAQAVPLNRWLGWAQAGLNGTEKGAPARAAALELLQALQQRAPEERSVLQALADALEDQGDYREAALLYRQLLRPQQA